ncbi:N-acetyltransferase, partial [Bacillus cereus]|nr:N-acetyltransferase [Bacillus cereus]
SIRVLEKVLHKGTFSNTYRLK